MPIILTKSTTDLMRCVTDINGDKILMANDGEFTLMLRNATDASKFTVGRNYTVTCTYSISDN